MSSSVTKPAKFDLHDLRLFVAVVNHGSISKGAEQISLALSAASTRIKLLEERLEVQLLIRNAKGITLTTAGQHFFDHSKRLLQLALDTQQGMDTLAGKGREHLQLLSNTTGLTTNLSRDLADFLNLNINVDIRLDQKSSVEVLKAVVGGQADLGFVDGEYDQNQLLFLPYQESRLVVISPMEHEFAYQPKVSFERFLQEPLIGLSKGASLQDFIERMAHLAGIPCSFRVQCPNFVTAANMVEKGLGVSMLPEPAAKRYSAQLKINISALKETWAERRVFLAMRPDRSTPLKALKLANYLCKTQISDFEN